MMGQKENISEGNRGILYEKKEEEEEIIGYREKLRKKLKYWERKFKEQEGRSPEKRDIKKDKKIKEYYKLYNRIRMGKIELNDEKIEKKEYLIKNYNKIEEIDNERDMESTIDKEDTGMLFGGNCEEIGPTPQKIGKPIGIFDDLYNNSYVLWKGHEEEEEDMTLKIIKTPEKKERNIERVKTPIKTQDKSSFLTTPVFLKRSMNITSSISPKFSFRTTLLSKKSLSSLIEELRQMENNFVDPEEVLKEIENQNSNTLIEEEKEPIEKIVSENKIWKKKGIKRSKKRVILRPVIIKKETKKIENQSNRLIDKKTFKENHILHENKTLSNIDKENTKDTGKHKRYIKGKGGVFLRSQVSRNYVSYKLRKYKSKFRQK
ncbi:hypothetical protein PNEG_03043 [Pneumocystis murina B123]|uniref:DNA replication regulator SLD2 n=1 Tax=Pneumocystis murina (strain B123) TaxID=1069680 RepID=M7P3X7_PNEMU|nr:hypothetical protein PNEG_03043 [Pneumocystis murina B123]EMR08565.1 hypothetical protein PNEG_03043 [Pneumocystis murina B123]